MENPFFVKGYHGPEYFCDREEECSVLAENATNNVNSTLLSIRRIGKTGLMKHLFFQLNKKRNTVCIYVDIYATQSLSDLTNYLASAIFNAFPPEHSLSKKFMLFLKSLSPSIAFDPLTGAPEVSFKYAQQKQYEHSLQSLFQFLDSQNKKVVLAFDEFQQVNSYPEKNAEALMRTIIQELKNVTFIFCGSQRHLLIEMFQSAKRPFFSSTQSIVLEKISKKEYHSFIEKMFLINKKSISEDSITFILKWTRRHTYYTQALCNKVFSRSKKKIDIDFVKECCDTILQEQEALFFQYRNLLTSSQWKLLKAIAKEDKVFQPTSYKFTNEYNLGNPASVKRSLEALIQKEMIYQIVNKKGKYYQVYDCFLSRWLERI